MISKEFLEAGHAIFTVSNPSGEYYTYKVSAPHDQSEIKPIWFISVLTGPDNTTDYSYLGILVDNKVRWTAKSKFNAETKQFKVVEWAINLILTDGTLPDGYKIAHIGKCARCGRPLTTPESLESGIGPICAGK